MCLVQELYWSIKGLAKMGARWSDFPCTIPSPNPSADDVFSADNNMASSSASNHHNYHPVTLAMATAVDRQVVTTRWLLHKQKNKVKIMLPLPDMRRFFSLPSLRTIFVFSSCRCRRCLLEACFRSWLLLRPFTHLGEPWKTPSLHKHKG